MSRDWNGTTSVLLLGSGLGALLTDAQPFTLTAWIYPEGLGENNGGRLICKEDLGGNAGSWFWALNTDTGMSFLKTFSVTSLRKASTTNAIVLNRWQHVAVSWDGGTAATGVIMYFNGVSAAVYNASTDGVLTIDSDAAEEARIGNLGNATRTWNGQIAEVHWYRRVLSQEEVQSLMHSPAIHSAGQVGAVGTAGLIGYWPLGGMANNEPDLSGNQTTGTLTSMLFSARVPPVNHQYGPQPMGGGYDGG